jgi:hypothetical protein
VVRARRESKSEGTFFISTTPADFRFPLPKHFQILIAHTRTALEFAGTTARARAILIAHPGIGRKHSYRKNQEFFHDRGATPASYGNPCQGEVYLVNYAC